MIIEEIRVLQFVLFDNPWKHSPADGFSRSPEEMTRLPILRDFFVELIILEGEYSVSYVPLLAHLSPRVHYS